MLLEERESDEHAAKGPQWLRFGGGWGCLAFYFTPFCSGLGIVQLAYTAFKMKG